jgi:hypothetical protein
MYVLDCVPVGENSAGVRTTINRAMTGELGSWSVMLADAAPMRPRLRPPPWTRLKQSDIDRMNEARAAAAAANAQQ